MAGGWDAEFGVFVFVGYAVLVWYAALKWRRTWRGYAAVLGGLLGVALVGVGHWWLNEITNGKVYLRVLQVMLYPYGGLVGVVGLFIALLPVRFSGAMCRRCGYDLRGLETDERTCPECSAVHALFHRAGESCRRCGGGLPGAPELDHHTCAACGTVHVLVGPGHREFDRERAGTPGSDTEEPQTIPPGTPSVPRPDRAVVLRDIANARRAERAGRES